MSKQSTEDEAAVPIPTSFEVNNDEQWAADHTELGQALGTKDQFRSDFVSYAASDESDVEMLCRMYPNFESFNADAQPVAVEDLGLPPNVEDQPVSDDGLVLPSYGEEQPVADDELGLPPNVEDHADGLGLPSNVEEQPVAADGLKMPPNVEEQAVAVDGLVLPAVTSDGVLSFPEEEEDEMMSVVQELGGEIINVLTEERIMAASRSIATTFELMNGTFEDFNDDATALIFPDLDSRQETSVEDEPSTQLSSGYSVSDSIATNDTSWSKKVLSKMMMRKHMETERTMTPVIIPEESREPEENRDNDDGDGLWSMLLVCGGLGCGNLRECVEDANAKVTDLVFPYDNNDDFSGLTEDNQEETARRAATGAVNDVFQEKKYTEKKSSKKRFKGGKIKKMFSRRKSSRAAKQQCELLA
mmetsp:Transcript_17797/g.35686  ORF Transcript_17797/g.35686 Transcript_17797/m.35686 type:complete len:416 (-) Transcript_17797:2088-3335(-)